MSAMNSQVLLVKSCNISKQDKGLKVNLMIAKAPQKRTVFKQRKQSTRKCIVQ